MRRVDDANAQPFESDVMSETEASHRAVHRGHDGRTLTEYQEALTLKMREAIGERVQRDQCLHVIAGGALRAIPANQISYIEDVPKATPLPRFPRAVVGLGTFRGRVLTLIDLDILFAPPPHDAPSHSMGLRRVMCIRGCDFGLIGHLSESFGPADKGANQLNAADLVQLAIAGSTLRAEAHPSAA